MFDNLGIVRLVLFFVAVFGFPVYGIGADWKPDANLEIVVPSGPGSGLDKTGRTIQKLIEQNKLVSVTSAVVNKPGGGGGIAYAYINQNAGNGNYLSISSPGVVTQAIVGASKINFRDITPIAQLFEENIAFMVLPDSKIQDAKILISLLKKDPSSVTFGVATALGGGNHVAAVSALKKAGVDIKRLRVVVFKSGSEATVALLGGHIDIVPIAAPITVSHVKSGKVKVIAVSSEKRLGGALANVPTWREYGIDSVHSSWRGIVAPKGLTQAQIAYWDGVFSKLTSLDDWKSEIEKNLWVANYLNSAASKDFLEKQHVLYEEIFSALGMIRK